MTLPTLLDGESFADVRATVRGNNPGMASDLADRIVSDAIAFVATAARFPTERLVPSRVVDEGWHALILHTRVYRKLCEGLGKFVHHYPERPDPGRFNQDVIDHTIMLIEEAGYTVHAELWRGPTDSLVAVAAKCQHSDDGGPIVVQPKPKPS
ncbi:hypothetical protein [Streptomyces sp. NPDC005336]|uniref:glycine-rich domain-containing protein n=1 Tax=Streptomyces sp. NPDC005336 TaxID=3157035 RepID=UPI0033A48094